MLNVEYIGCKLILLLYALTREIHPLADSGTKDKAEPYTASYLRPRHPGMQLIPCDKTSLKSL